MAGKSTISLKLLLDNDSKKVIFAEAGKDFVDLLFAFLEQPLGSIVRLLAEQGMAGSWSFSKVYESVKNLDPNYIQPEQTKDNLLHPARPNSNTGGNSLMQELGYPRPQSHSSSSRRRDDDDDDDEEELDFLFQTRKGYPEDEKKLDGYVKGMAMYMISDDLTVKPVSPISSISFLNALRVKDIGSLQEKNVEIDIRKALELVKTSFESTTVLTDVFVGKLRKEPTVI